MKKKSLGLKIKLGMNGSNIFLNSRKNFFKFSGKAIVKNQVMAIANFSAMLTV